MSPTRTFAFLSVLTALLLPSAAKACGPTDWNCQAIWTCHAPGSFPGWQALNSCSGGSAVCIAYNTGLPLAVFVPCGGASASQSTPLSLDAFLASLNETAAGQGAAPPRVSRVERDEVLRVLDREDAAPLTPRECGASDAPAETP